VLTPEAELVGRLIIKYMERHELTARGLAKKLGVTHGAVSRWTSGNRLPELPLALRLAEILRFDGPRSVLGCYRS
jgi:transcriptional regulator with XRE-family HTH domain